MDGVSQSSLPETILIFFITFPCIGLLQPVLFSYLLLMNYSTNLA